MRIIDDAGLTRHGHLFVLRNDSYISRSLVTYGEWTQDEAESLAQFLRPGDAVTGLDAHPRKAG